MKFLASIIAIFFLVSTQSWALKGSITNNSGTPLEKVKISFSKTDTVVYTDAEGVFSVEIVTPIIHTAVERHSSLLTYTKGILKLSLPAATTVELSLYSAQGREIMALNRIFTQGTHQLQTPALAHGPYIMRAKIGSEQFVQKFVSSDNLALTAPALPTYARGLRDTEDDTVCFSLMGYADILIPISSYDTELEPLVLKRIGKTYGGTASEGSSAITPAEDGFIITGSTNSFGAEENDYWILKIDEQGDTLWTKTYGGPEYDAASTITPTEGGYLISGYSDLYHGSSWMLKIDEMGDTIGTNVLNTLSDFYRYTVYATTPAKEGNIITGTAIGGSGAFLSLWMAKIDQKGDTLWFNQSDPIVPQSIIPAKEGYIISGSIEIPNDTNPIGFTYDIGYTKIDEEGNVLWTKNVGKEEGGLGSASTPAENGYIVTGYSGGHLRLLKIDEQGETLWFRSYDKDLDKVCPNAITPAESGYIITGYMLSVENHDNFWAAKINEQGDILWSHTYGGSQKDRATAITPTESGYVITGTTESFGAGEKDIWAVKIDEDGNPLWFE